MMGHARSYNSIDCFVISIVFDESKKVCLACVADGGGCMCDITHSEPRGEKCLLWGCFHFRAIPNGAKRFTFARVVKGCLEGGLSLHLFEPLAKGSNLGPL